MLKSNPVPLLFLLAALSGLLAPAMAADPVLTYQRIHVLVAGHDNRISLRVWEDGRMEMRFPVYSPRAGLHQRMLSRGELEQLAQILDRLPAVAQQQLNERLQQAGSETLVKVSDADIVRIEYRRPDDPDIMMAVPSPEIWSDVAPHVAEFSAMAATERDLRQWMDQQLELAGSTP